MIGYKAFDKDLKCRNMQFEVGKTYKTDAKKDEMRLCSDTVIHFCRELHLIENVSNYRLSESRICEVIASGDIIDDGSKFGTNKITILRELTKEEKERFYNYNIGYRNTGDHNTGNCNAGDHNKGNWNTGDHNTGDSNIGDHNKGNWNTGDRNTGNCNIGNCNIGNWNIGDRNIGYRNTGDHNTGDWNIGDNNTGKFNTGNRNTGGHNAGSWNTGDNNTGYFNTKSPPIIMFNKPIKTKVRYIEFPDFLYFQLTVWVSGNNATNEEKKQYKEEIEVCGGFLKSLSYKEAFRIAWDKASKEEHKKLLALPNWDNAIFKEISGIDAEAEIAKENEQ